MDAQVGTGSRNGGYTLVVRNLNAWRVCPEGCQGVPCAMFLQPYSIGHLLAGVSPLPAHLERPGGGAERDARLSVECAMQPVLGTAEPWLLYTLPFLAHGSALSGLSHALSLPFGPDGSSHDRTIACTWASAPFAGILVLASHPASRAPHPPGTVALRNHGHEESGEGSQPVPLHLWLFVAVPLLLPLTQPLLLHLQLLHMRLPLHLHLHPPPRLLLTRIFICLCLASACASASTSDNLHIGVEFVHLKCDYKNDSHHHHHHQRRRVFTSVGGGGGQ